MRTRRGQYALNRHLGPVESAFNVAQVPVMGSSLTALVICRRGVKRPASR